MLQKIMFVEDEPGIRVVAQLALEQLGGYEVCLCDSGQAALDEVLRFQPQLVLLDVMMPGMDGIQTFHALRALPETAAIPIVFITAKSLQEELQDLTALGASGIIRKPFDPVELPRQVRAFWEQAQQR